MGFLGWKFLLVLICILVVNACDGFAQKKSEHAASHINSEIPNKDYSKLLAKAQAAGSVRIIAKLNMPFVPEGLLASAQEAVDQQVLISKMQDQLCAALSTFNVKEIKKFKYTPYIAMEVNSTALAALISNPLVISIAEDAPVPPALNSIGDPGYSQSSFKTSIGDISPGNNLRRVGC